MDPDKEAEKNAIAEIVRNCLSELPENERSIVYRRYFKGETLKAIAHSLGVSSSNASLICTKALKRMHCSLERYGIEE
jgi:RNA polymerase sigma factor (sigma-70 family)